MYDTLLKGAVSGTLPQVPPENVVPLASDTGEQVQLPFIVADDASLDTPDEGMAVPAT